MSKKPKPSRNKAKDVEKKPVPPIAPLPRQQTDNQTALQFLDGVIALSPVNRQTHIQAQAALQQIERAIAELEQLKKKKVNGVQP